MGKGYASLADQIGDILITLVADSIDERALMPKPSVEALVKVMLGPIEDRLREMELAEKDRRLKAIEAQVKFYPGSVTLEKDELARLRRIEKAVQNVVSSWNTGRSLDSVYVELSGAIRS